MTTSSWSSFAKYFELLSSPGRPSADDIAFVRNQLLSLNKPINGILLGVTKELAKLASEEINITAVDNSLEMIKHQWIGNSSNRTVILDDWLNLPSQFTSVDFVIGDGVFTVLDRKSSHLLMECVRAVLSDDGIFIVRLFCSPEMRESFEHIYHNTTNNLNAFEWRLAQSMCDSNFEVCMKNFLDRFKQVISASDIEHFGWTKEQLSTIEPYANSPCTLTFMTETVFKELCKEHGMEIINRFTGSYELSERCPTFVLRKA
ncbi:unnamed protein product [Adineta ricciae]|uniref:Methyltransferase type 11 domain-containing protein n=1 Tax=Adineta ricciae TaxID=249248 RepID=A0A815IAP2_ADIRI|nr:unnamed protein product [Adineta ricciae]